MGQNRSLYQERFEHDACGIGVVASIEGIKSYSVVDKALVVVERLEHRAGKDAAGETGDGVGIMLQISHEFFCKAAAEAGITLGGERDYGVGMFFFPADDAKREAAMKAFEGVCADENLTLLGWRRVPVDPSILGERARAIMPVMLQCFIARPEAVSRGIDFDRRLYIARRVFEKLGTDTYVVSLSSRTIIYKGMFLVNQLREFYADLRDESYKCAIALVHSRFSTNTNPSWERAHPYRFILHNGEINTIRGNVDRMIAREETMRSPVMSKEDYTKLFPVINTEGSDSAILDNTLEFLVMNGMDLPLAVMTMIPEPWTNDKNMSEQKRDFYHYYATMMEPWDGPASILFTDGDMVGAVLDRNGLRPSRYYITSDNMLILSSEVGVFDFPADSIVKKARLQPGKILLLDTVAKRIISDEECKAYYAGRHPYGEWLDQNLINLQDLPIPNKIVPTSTDFERERLYKAFGYSYEDVRDTILPMAKTAAEPTGAMGCDIPLAVLSEKQQLLFRYFKQLFAQVTNPPIDSLREEIVTDTTVYLGSDGNLLMDKGENCAVLQIKNPILTGVELLKIKALNRPGFKTETVSLLYEKGSSLKEALDRLFENCDRAYRENGSNILVLSDRGVNEKYVAIPSLLAVSAMEQHLIRTKKRTAVSVILESAEPREVHHFAVLLSYGARAVNPYLAHECIGELIEKKVLDKDYNTAILDYNESVLHGIVKTSAKMGITPLQSYQSAQVFETVGIRGDVVEKYFSNTVTRIGGIGLEEMGEDVVARHDRAFDPRGLTIDTTLDSPGLHKLRSGEDKEEHLYNPATIVALQQATANGDYKRFKEYTALVNDETQYHTLRGLLDFVTDDSKRIPLDEVEPASEIVKRFKTGAMSYGSISGEAHECMAIAMNRLGGKSNSGEGGENPARFGTEKNSAIKQVASGRFGVTSQYLNSAVELQIKMAQGAKPGEGGQLPGMKVYPWIAKTRCSTPGVTLISPPPHHDIYSIEDLAQLIFDLKNANRRARISVKLVSEAGVGTIASGVAKAGAQVILISGYDGGTGAAPLSSIHNAGLPWELGLAETHQTLIRNGLRSCVTVETDGKLMSGRDVAIAALLGAEEFGFATAPLVTMGCMMMRVCHLDTCPFGVATQNEMLRARFRGKPEYVMNFMLFIAEELREIMAELGIRKVDEMVGRSDLLRPKSSIANKRAETVDLSLILNSDYAHTEKRRFNPKDAYNFKLEQTADISVLLREFEDTLKNGGKKTVSVAISSTDRAFGTILGSEITARFGTGLEEDTFTVRCSGSGGQSFGAFIPKGLTLELEGDSNDYFGKGLSGGKLIVYPPKESIFDPSENIVIGNVALYGATSGEAYISGVAGERFCVRNSGATAVVEGCGDHGLEYMTGGCAVILGATGKNVAAGMSGGIAYILDTKHDLYRRLNKGMVSMSEIKNEEDAAQLKGLIEKHVALTGSALGKKILDSFESYLPNFKKITPNDYSRIMSAIKKYKAQGLSDEDAELKAFNDTKKEG